MFGGLNIGSFFEKRTANESSLPIDYTKKVVVKTFDTPLGSVTTKTTMDPITLEDKTIPYSDSMQAIELYKSGKAKLLSENIIDLDKSDE